MGMGKGVKPGLGHGGIVGMGKGVKPGLGHGGIICVLQTQFSYYF